MQCLAVIVLLITAGTSDGLSCVTSDEDWEAVSFVGLDPDEFLKELRESLTSEIISDDVCRVSIELDYDDDELTKQFTEDLNDDELTSGEIRFSTFVSLMFHGIPYLANSLEYACSEVECEIDFVEDHLAWLLDASYPTLAVNASSLITHGTGRAGKNFTQLIIEHCLVCLLI